MPHTPSPRKKLTDLALVAMFAAVMAVCAWITVPAAVPFTLQTFGVFLTVGVLGGKKGTLSVAVYLLLGAFGLPVFSGFSGGVGQLAGSTGGYLVGFLFSALVMWAMERLFGGKKAVLALSMALALLVCYAFGTAWFMIVYAKGSGPIGLLTALSWCVFPYILPDAVKILLALLLCGRLRRVFHPGETR